MILNKSPLLRASWECTKFLFFSRFNQGTCFPSWDELWMLHLDVSEANAQGCCLNIGLKLLLSEPAYL